MTNTDERCQSTGVSWCTCEDVKGGRVIFVHPPDDLMAHVLTDDPDDCVCGPSVLLIQSTAGDFHILTHHSLDGRENAEEG